MESLAKSQQSTTTHMQAMLQRLEDLKKEEHNLSTAVDRTDDEIQHKMSLRMGLKERLRHCNAALNALSTLKYDDVIQGTDS